MRIAREGYPYIIPLFLISILLFAFKIYWAAALFFVLASFCTFFFRDPERIFRGTEKQIAAPADGRVVSIRKEDNYEAVSIFLSVFDVHVNRAPSSGVIKEISFMKGKFLFAFDERASIENERNVVTLDHGGIPVRFVQIAGVLARRIVFWRKVGEALKTGERVGLIKFGSRLDVFLPAGSSITVKKGDRVRAGESVIGELQ
ncbi:MAG TPA: phosphatidylserine decarboxylase family protein [Acidobacteriota bacterium]|nr:phosphatidylserine decarboxylase family protein [Acidobacteriota bacterium]